MKLWSRIQYLFGAIFAVRFAFLAGLALLAATRLAASASPDAPAQPLTKPTESVASADPKGPGHFRGQVTNLDGKPVKGARLHLLAWSEQFDYLTPVQPDAGALPIRAKTDSDGRFDFDAPDMVFTDVDGLPAQKKCLVIATADGYGPDWRRIADRTNTWGRIREKISDPVDPIDIALQISPDDAPIRGRLLDPDGHPLAEARVLLEDLKIPVGQGLKAFIEHVTRPDSGYQAAPRFARSFSQDVFLPGVTAETRTDADGRFTLRGLGCERVAQLKVTAPGVVDTTFWVMTRNAPEIGANRIDGKPQSSIPGAEFTRQLEPGATISGVVRDRDTKQPIAGMWVGWSPEPLKGVRTGAYPRTTDVNGRFTISGIDPQKFDLPAFDKEFGFNSHHEVMAVSTPGLPFQTEVVEAKRDEEVVVECARGVPFRLKLLDDQGQPVLADVTYCGVSPNPYLQRTFRISTWRANYYEQWISRAAHRGGGIYEGFVVPGPGAVLARIPNRAGYRSARVDPKAFFEPGRTKWTPQEQTLSYGTQDTLMNGQHWSNQHDYVAIVLVNPPEDSAPLELSATVLSDKPRQVTLVDPDGKPVVGVQTKKMTFDPNDIEPLLRSASFSLSGLNPGRTNRITLIEERRKLIAVLLARGDDEAPYTVVMRPWGAVIGQILDQDGKPTRAALSLRPNPIMEAITDPDQGDHAKIEIDDEGRFRIDQLVPGQRYTVQVTQVTSGVWPGYSGLDIANFVVSPGERRNLGRIRTPPPADQLENK